jgi:L-alanine-DL-glutamate epimerase-like enolase superfamily enzyme
MVHDTSAVMPPPRLSATVGSVRERCRAGRVWSEYVPWFDSIVTNPFEIVDGEVVVSDQPGSRFGVDPDAVERMAQTVWLPLAG